MKNKKFLILLILVLIIILFFIFKIIKNFNLKPNENAENNLYSDYTPEEEISTNQLRETTVTLYFLDEGSNTLKTEGRLVDSKLLLENPYKEMVELLINGPKNTSLKNIFPENIKLIDAKLENNCVILNFSKELLYFDNDTEKYNIINSLLNTLSNLNEVNSIKILINNEITKEFNENYTIKNN